MSLFPAYESQEKTENSSQCKNNGSDKNQPDFDWSANSSFQATIIPQRTTIELSSDSSDTESVQILPSDEIVNCSSNSSCEVIEIPKKKAKKQKASKKHSRKEKVKVKYELDVENVYFEDKRRDRGNSSVDTLPSRARPLYNLRHTPIGSINFWPQYKKENALRYYSVNIDAPEKSKKKDTVIKRAKTSNDQGENVPEATDYLPNAEEQIKNLTKEYNEKLGDSPHDTNLWLRYAEFQESSHRFESGNETAIRQKKLSIIERGLDKNSGSKELLREKLRLMGELYPADQFSTQLETLINKETGNILLWQTLIMATQNSVAMCTVPKVIDLYSKCFGTLRLWSRTSSRNHDERLLEMLYQYFIFLRQAGLWEQMWETLRLNLTLNLGLSKDALRFQRSMDEKKLIELEEVILPSRLPLNQLWVRVESLRENSHWISVDRDQLELIGDSHRFVSPEDVTDFVHPMLTRDSNMRLAIYALITLKVPLLPTGDTILKDLGLDNCGWTVDSIEPLLAMFYPAVGEMAGHEKRKLLMEGVLPAGLTSGPQYLRFHPAQEPYLDFVRDVFRVIAESLSPIHRTSLYVWWLRFERMLVYLCKGEPKSDSRCKRLKGVLKEFLKKSVNRNNVHFYREYALIERELGRHDSCINILETAIKSASTSSKEDQAAVLSLRRTLLETLLDIRHYDQEKKLHAKRIFLELIPSNDGKSDLEHVETYFREYLEQFLAETPSNELESLDHYFLPNSISDNIACYAYFLYVNDRELSEILEIYDACTMHTKGLKYLQERLYENQIVVLQLLADQNRSLNNTICCRTRTALDSYPDNFYLLSVISGLESEKPCWDLSTRQKNHSFWQNLSSCLGGRARINLMLGSRMEAGVTAAINKLIFFHRRLASDPTTQHCPLVWRLFMLLLREHNLSEEKGEETYHKSVAQCPWTRSIYIDAAEIAPQLLTQMQDVIREKDLRMHVTPEELDILRG